MGCCRRARQPVTTSSAGRRACCCCGGPRAWRCCCWRSSLQEEGCSPARTIVDPLLLLLFRPAPPPLALRCCACAPPSSPLPLLPNATYSGSHSKRKPQAAHRHLLPPPPKSPAKNPDAPFGSNRAMRPANLGFALSGARSASVLRSWYPSKPFSRQAATARRPSCSLPSLAWQQAQL